MSDLEQRLRETYRDHAAEAPTSVDLPALLESASARRRRGRVLMLAASVLLISLVGAGLFSALQPSALSPGSTGADVKPAATVGKVSLITTGECAGLQLTATTGAGTGNWRIAPGRVDNLITMSGNQLLYLKPVGPCASQLRFRTTNPTMLQGPDPSVDAAPNDEGVALLISHAPRGGMTTVDVYGECSGGGPCLPGDTILATITFNLTTAPIPTTSPAPDPSASRS